VEIERRRTNAPSRAAEPTSVKFSRGFWAGKSGVSLSNPGAFVGYPLDTFGCSLIPKERDHILAIFRSHFCN
jgi:hypothetical protein